MTNKEAVQLDVPDTNVGDMISRQAAIDAWKADFKGYVDCLDLLRDDYNGIMEYIDETPSAQPDLDEWCTDCKEYDHEKHCCPRWNRVIRQTLKDAQPDIIRCKDCKYSDENWRRVSVKWLPCMDIRPGSNWYCGSAERREK